MSKSFKQKRQKFRDSKSGVLQISEDLFGLTPKEEMKNVTFALEQKLAKFKPVHYYLFDEEYGCWVLDKSVCQSPCQICTRKHSQ